MEKISVFGFIGENEIFSYDLDFIPRVGDILCVESLDKRYEVKEVYHNINDVVHLHKCFTHNVTLEVLEYNAPGGQ